MKSKVVREDAAASYVGLSESTLRKARLYGWYEGQIKPPPHMRLGRAIRYRLIDLDRWLEAMATPKVFSNGGA